jgi:hypothetical protein
MGVKFSSFIITSFTKTGKIKRAISLIYLPVSSRSVGVSLSQKKNKKKVILLKIDVSKQQLQ